MYYWRHGVCDGVVINGPWCCNHSLIGESFLRHQRHIPMHFVYNDGTPIDACRLAAFAYRLNETARPASSANRAS